MRYQHYLAGDEQQRLQEPDAIEHDSQPGGDVLQTQG